MGIFDTIKDFDLRCPYCGNSVIGDGSIQTKDLNPGMNTYYIHKPDGKCMCEDGLLKGSDHGWTQQLKYIRAHGSCRSPMCRTLAEMESLTRFGHVSGGGRYYDIEYPVDDEGRVSGPARITIPKEQTDTWKGEQAIITAFHTWLSKLPDGGDAFEKQVEKYHGNEGIAVQMTNWDKLLKEDKKEM